MFDVIRMWNEMMGCVSSKLGGCLKQLASVSGSGNWKLLNVRLEVVQHPAPTGEIMWSFLYWVCERNHQKLLKHFPQTKYIRWKPNWTSQSKLSSTFAPIQTTLVRFPNPLAFGTSQSQTGTPSRQTPLTHRSKLCVDFCPRLTPLCVALFVWSV